MLGLDAAGKTSEYLEMGNSPLAFFNILSPFLTRSDTLQAEAGPVSHHNPHSGFQRGDSHLQERQVQRLGKTSTAVIHNRYKSFLNERNVSAGCRRPG